MELEFYKLPFSDKYKCGYIYDANSNFIFQFETYDTNIYNEILNHLNSDKLSTECNFRLHPDDPICIQMKNDKGWTDIITIRGWGSLTGKGGYDLHPDKAIELQDSLVKWLLYKLNK